MVTQFKIEAVPGTPVPGTHEPPKDPLMEQARNLVKNQEQILASFLQRKLQIGYPRAARLKELLDEERTSQAAKPPPEPPAGGASGT